MTEYVAHPFTTMTIGTEHREDVLLTSHTSAARDPHLPSSSYGLDRQLPDITTPDDFLSPHGSDSDEVDLSEGYEQENEFDDEHDFHLPQQFDNQHVIYNYFAKSRSRLRNQDSVPFIFLGPSVDHWQIVGQTLSSRGFSVIACERDDVEDGDGLVKAILESLRWNRAILVGCDREAVMAIKAALSLAPDQVAGLILCGDLREAHKMVGGDNLDEFLDEHMECPYSVIWDGDGSYSLDQHHCLIRGGGSAPHRRLPEQFAWALTRFVEEQVAPVREAIEARRIESSPGAPTILLRRFKFLDKLFTPGGWLVTGRVLAEAVFYVSALKVALYQYENIYDGMSRLHKGYRSLAVFPRRAMRLLGQTLFAWGAKSKADSKPVSQEEVVGVLQEEEEPEVQPQEEEDVPEVVEELPRVEEEETQPPSKPNQEVYNWPLPLLNPVVV